MPRRLGREKIAWGPIKRPKLGQFDIQTLFTPDRQTDTVTAKKERKAAWAGVTVPLQPALLDEPWDNQNLENPQQRLRPSPYHPQVEGATRRIACFPSNLPTSSLSPPIVATR